MLSLWVVALMAEVIITILILLLEDVIELFLLIFMFLGAHHQQRPYCMEYYNYKKKSEIKVH